MPIDFSCTGCAKQLRVSDDSAGKDARCPECGSINRVPAAGAASIAPTAAPPPLFNPASSAPASSNPFGAAAVNPYAAPQAAAYKPDYGQYATGEIRPTVVGVEPILKYAWQIWQENLGLLVGAYATFLGISFATLIPLLIVQGALQANNNEEAAVVVALAGHAIAMVVQIFLGTGLVQITLKLARRQRAEFGELFGGGSRFLPVLGVSLLLGVAIFVGTMACIVPGILLLLMLWPAYFLVIDNKSPVMESFGKASEITKGNWGTGFLLLLLAYAMELVGFLVLCVGLLFAIPLIMMMATTAYLMMSGQIPAYSQPQPQPAYK
jgi:hypothetical protein